MIYSSLLNISHPNAAEWSGEWKTVSGSCRYRYSDLELAVQSAEEWFLKLKNTSYQDRKSSLLKMIELLENQKEELLNLVKSEQGRTEADFELEWCQLKRFFSSLQNDQELSADSYDSRGVCATIGSLVWPIFYSLQFFCFNFLAGNPVILKPSEKVSLTILALFKKIRQDMPWGEAIQVLLGEKEVGRRLVCHEKVAVVIFQGSFEVGMRVRQDTLSQPSKEVLLYLGAKNPYLIFDDASEKAIEALIEDAFMGAGQDCQSASVVFIQNGIFDSFLSKLHEQAKSFKIGLGRDALMGSFADGAMMDRYLKFIGISEREGAKILMRGKPLQLNEPGHFSAPTLAVFNHLSPDQMRKSVSLQTEILGPHLSVIRFSDEKDLLPLLGAMVHARSVSIWTSQQERFNWLSKNIGFGQILNQQSLRKGDPWKSFHFRKKSGNHAVLGRDLFEKLLFKVSTQA